jgi:hypothetical protein
VFVVKNEMLATAVSVPNWEAFTTMERRRERRAIIGRERARGEGKRWLPALLLQNTGRKEKGRRG